MISDRTWEKMPFSTWSFLILLLCRIEEDTTRSEEERNKIKNNNQVKFEEEIDNDG